MIDIGSLSQIKDEVRSAQLHHKRVDNNLEVSGQIIDRHMEAQSQNRVSSQEKNMKKQNKRNLLKLMVLVKFQRFGYNYREVLPILEEQIAKINHLDRISSRNLSEEALQLFRSVLAIVIGEERREPQRENAEVMKVEEVEEVREEERREDWQLPARIQHFGDPEWQRRQNLQIREVQPEPRVQFEESQQHIRRRQRMQHLGLPPLRTDRLRSRTILCNICYLTSRNFCEQECGHAFCVQCMQGYIRENMRSDNYLVKCPQYDCRQKVSMTTIREMLKPAEYDRFKRFNEKHLKEMDPNNRFCSRPDCGEVLQQEGEVLICKKCNVEYCGVCLQGRHQGRGCDAVLRGELEHTYKTYDIRKCPSCRSPIEKADGCNHMTCRKCKYEFCWICGGKYSRHHFRYYNCFGCPGMQYEDSDQVIFQRFKQFLFYLVLPFIIILLLVSYLLALPLNSVVNFVYRPCLWTGETDKMEMRIARRICCEVEWISFCFGWLLFQLRALMYALFVAPVRFTFMAFAALGRMLE